VNHRETHDLVAVILDEGGDIDEVADRILLALSAQGDEVLVHLDPPPGLKRWLESHGLSLVATQEVAAPRVWELVEAEEVAEDREHRPHIPVLQIGDYVQYRTAPAGPRQVSTLGAGAVVEVHLAQDLVVVQGDPHDIYLHPGAGDFIEVIRSSAPDF
jgi:hypothetical protein